MATPIPYLNVNGARQSFNSIILKLDGQEFAGFKGVDLSRKRNRTIVYGNNTDPIGKTRGVNEYSATLEVYVAEFNTFVVSHFGAGYGDVMFPLEVTMSENGFDTKTYLATGCTIDEASLSAAQGSEPLTIKLDLKPTKIVFGGIDDNSVPLTGAPAQA